MKVTPRIVLLAGLLGSAAAAWGGFLLGGGSRSSALAAVSPPVAVENRQASADTAATHAQPHKTPFSNVPSRAENHGVEQQPTFSNAPNQEVTSARSVAAMMANAGTTPPSNRHRVRVSSVEQTPPRYPLVMMELPADTLNAQPGVAAAMGRLREKFIAEVGGTGQNPADPAYQARWTQSVSSIEEQLRAAVGWEAYNQLQAAAYFAQKTVP
jgi:hypothetical protein